jgi:hypothetical protein
MPGKKSSEEQNLPDKWAGLKNLTKLGKSEIGCGMLGIWPAADGTDGVSAS